MEATECTGRSTVAALYSAFNGVLTYGIFNVTGADGIFARVFPSHPGKRSRWGFRGGWDFYEIFPSTPAKDCAETIGEDGIFVTSFFSITPAKVRAEGTGVDGMFCTSVF